MSMNGTKIFSGLVAHRAVAVPAVGGAAEFLLVRDMVRLQQ